MRGNPIALADPSGAEPGDPDEQGRGATQGGPEDDGPEDPPVGPLREGTVYTDQNDATWVWQRNTAGEHEWVRGVMVTALRELSIPNMVELPLADVSDKAAEMSEYRPYLDLATALEVYSGARSLPEQLYGESWVLRHGRNAERLTELGQPVMYDEYLARGINPIPLHEPSALEGGSVRIGMIRELQSPIMGSMPMRSRVFIEGGVVPSRGQPQRREVGAQHDFSEPSNLRNWRM